MKTTDNILEYLFPEDHDKIPGLLAFHVIPNLVLCLKYDPEAETFDNRFMIWNIMLLGLLFINWFWHLIADKEKPATSRTWVAYISVVICAVAAYYVTGDFWHIPFAPISLLIYAIALFFYTRNKKSRD